MITMVLVFIDDVAVVIDCNFLNNCCVVAVIIPIILTFYSVCKRGCKKSTNTSNGYHYW
jgi:Na+/H+ antiporter NhaB